jgi:hypothetical protein
MSALASRSVSNASRASSLAPELENAPMWGTSDCRSTDRASDYGSAGSGIESLHAHSRSGNDSVTLVDIGSVEMQQEAVCLGHLEQTSPTPIRVVLLILSAFREPWSSWQKDGQDQTFLRDIPDGVIALRYSGLAREKRPKFRTAIFLKKTQHALQTTGWLGSLPVASRILRYLSRLRVGDSTIAEIKNSAGQCASVKGPSTFSSPWIKSSSHPWIWR